LESGDLHFVEAFPAAVLVVVLDGLGHGPRRRWASRVAAATLHDNLGKPVTRLVERCHVALQRTRGVVLSLAMIESQGREMTWLGIGNVDGTLYRANATQRRESLPHRGGVVGFQLPQLRVTTLPLAPGDTLVFATDGITSTFASESPIGWHPQEAADYILQKYGKDNDDALVVVARNIGGAA
jgi:negative regulator of sigma-B (phosphoserine phosphatase)